MTTTFRLLAFLSLIGAVAHADVPVAASLWPPDKQTAPAGENIRGVRFNIYGRNANLSGADIGFGNELTGDLHGVQIFGLYNGVGGTMTGAQLGLLNASSGYGKGVKVGFFNWDEDKDSRFKGANVGLANIARHTEITGAQVGFVNYAKTVHGVQLGIVNFADNLHGVQIGLWNQVNSRSWGDNDPMPRGFPIINIGRW